MKKKELKNIALKIAEAEKVLDNKESSKEEIASAKETILLLSKKVYSLEDMMELDDMVQKFLN